MVFQAISDTIALPYILATIVIGAVLYLCVFRSWNYFTDRGVKFLRGVPFMGVQYKYLLGFDNIAGAHQSDYNRFPDDAFFGIFEALGQTAYVIRDPEVIKQVAIKDFDHFVNHRTDISEEVDPLLGRSLFSIRDEKWRDMRSTWSPAFSGSKMRLMLGLVAECADEFCKQLSTELGAKKREFDLKDLFTRFANDAIATSVFGLKINSLVDKDNHFYKTGLVVTNFDGVQGLKFLGFQVIPKVMNALGITFFDKDQTKFFRDLVHNNITYREQNNIIRHDMINLVMEAKKGQLGSHGGTDGKYKDIGFATVQESTTRKSIRQRQEFNDDDFVAQCMVFFLAGFNGVSIGQCFMAYELAVNQDIQERLYKEIEAANAKLNGEPLTYEALQEMKYLDMVVSEMLRRWPLAPTNERIVNKPYLLKSFDGTSKVNLDVGDAIWIPTYALHMDPQYYPNPEQFDPERFNDENKSSIRSGTYLPFGIGPRNCIGSRYALMAIKSVFFYLLLNFSLHPSGQTKVPLKLKRGASAILSAEGGFWAELRRRN